MRLVNAASGIRSSSSVRRLRASHGIRRGATLTSREVCGILVAKDTSLRSAATCDQSGGAVERHGSETYFVIGEGLLGEELGGRDAILLAAHQRAGPAFCFSRPRPHGTGEEPG